MKNLDILKNTFDFMSRMRRSGTTTLLRKISDEMEAWVLVPYEEDKKEFFDSALSFEDLNGGCGREPKPILVDNYTMMKLLSMAITEIEVRDAQINDLLAKMPINYKP
jgi:hypothetical protein